MALRDTERGRVSKAVVAAATSASYDENVAPRGIESDMSGSSGEVMGTPAPPMSVGTFLEKSWMSVVESSSTTSNKAERLNDLILYAGVVFSSKKTWKSGGHWRRVKNFSRRGKEGSLSTLPEYHPPENSTDTRSPENICLLKSCGEEETDPSVQISVSETFDVRMVEIKVSAAALWSARVSVLAIAVS